nr:hypothetical protein [Bradyrhizobium stylosanthis]
MVYVRDHRHECRVEIACLLAVIIGTPVDTQKACLSGKLHVLDHRAAVKTAFFCDRRV